MAAHSGGAADWSSVIKPLLNNRTGNLNKNDIINVIKAILKNENEFFEEESNHLQFYTTFAALAADKLSQCKSLCQTQVPQMYDACLVLIRFILSRLSKVGVHEIKWLLPALKSLCEGKSHAIAQKSSATTTTTTTETTGGSTITSTPSSTSLVLQFDYNLVAAQLKSSKYPESGKSVVGSDKESPKSETKRSRSDLSSVIIAQLTAPLEAGKFTWTPLSEELTDCSELFASSSVAYLQSLNGADIILDMCISLPILSRYAMRFEDTVAALGSKQLYLPLTQTEAAQIRSQVPQIVIDISILWQALTLPIMEPLSPERIEKLSKCAIAALYCAVLTSISSSVCNMSSSVSVQKTTSAAAVATVASAASVAKDTDETEEQTRFIVDKALEIYTIIGNLLQTSTRAHIYQNHLCFGAWLLVTGIQGALGASGSSSSSNSAAAKQAVTTNTPSITTATTNAPPPPPTTTTTTTATTTTTDETTIQKTKTSAASSRTPETPTTATARVNLFKVQQGFGVLNAAIANHSIKLLIELIDDLKIESTSYPANAENSQQIPEPAGFNILASYSSLQRIVRVLNTATLHQSFTFLATAAYRKACALKRANAKDRLENEPISFSDSTTYFNDTLSCSDHSEEDDSEGYLGHWFKETLAPEEAENAAVSAQTQSNNTADGEKSNLVSALDEPHEYLDLAAQIFCFLDKFFANKHIYLHRYVKAGLSDQQMLLIANILKDLDRDAARGETDTAACAKWQTAMVHFSGAVGRYLHNLIAAGLLNESLQSSLLQHLSVSPWSTETNSWPLQVYSSTLSILVQILLLKPMQEKEAACLSVWHRLINTLVEGVCATSATTVATDTEYEDLNIEHAQILLFLFHALNLMQKKSILLLTAGGVIRCAEICRNIAPERILRNSQIMLLTRLLLLLEYLMKHLYNAPAELLDQVRWNLFSVSSLQENQTVSEFINSKSKMMCFCRKDIEERFRQKSAEYASNIRPTFYSLTSIEGVTSQTEFKLDGLAWNFILSTPDKLKYPLLIDALNDILCIADLSQYKISTHTLCAIQFCFSVCWKLLLGMPPPTAHIESLMEDRSLSLIPLMWGIRSPMSFTQQLIAQSLIKQGMYTQLADKFWYSLTDRVMDLRYSLKQTYLSVQHFNASVDKSQPRLSQIILLDAIVAHVFAAAWADKHNIKQIRCTPPSSNASSSAAATAGATAAPFSVALETEILGIVGKSNETDVAAKTNERAQSTQELLLALIESYEIIAKYLRNHMLQQLSDGVPQHIVEFILPFVSSKNVITAELGALFLKKMPDHDVEIMTIEWPKFLISFETVWNSKQYVVEEFTLSVIDAHIEELTKQSNYTHLNSLKHCLFNILNTLELLLPRNTATMPSMTQISDALKQLCINNKLDLRFEFAYEVSDKCLKTLFNENNCSDGSEQHKKSIEAQMLLSFDCSIKHCYTLILELCEELRQQPPARVRNFCESMLFAVLKTLTQLADNSIALQAMQRFFKQERQGSLVELMLCFTGTSMSMTFAKKVLQFVEKLFVLSELQTAGFPLEDLHECFCELGNVDEVRVKNWLSHVIYGPNGMRLGANIGVSDKNAASSAQVSSTPSSNAQTPTNMATVSAMPSLSDQLAQTSAALEADIAMDIDDDNAVASAVNNMPTATSLVLWQNTGNSYLTNQSEESCSQLDNQNERNGAVLLSVIKHIVRDAKTAKCIHPVLYQSLQHLGSCLLTPPQETTDFADILQVLITLADTGQNRGHESLFSAINVWLEVTRFYVLEKTCGGKSVNQCIPQSMLETINALLKYLSELLQSLGFKGSKHLNPPWDDDVQTDLDELMDDAPNGVDDEDSLIEDSDEDNLNNKLCTFSQTQKEFMSQHWYHCHTCNMVNTVGVCSICARVCHKGHDVSYAKYGNFFCDCGAKEDGFCQALTRRAPTHPMAAGGSLPGKDAEYVQGYAGNLNMLPIKKRALTTSSTSNATNSAPTHRTTALNERIALLAKLIEGARETLQNADEWSNVVRCILEFFEVLVPNIRENATMFSIVGCHQRATTALERLHMPEQAFEMNDQLMVPTLGSQEGAFENVRMNYSGDQGQTIKQLLSSGLVRRVALCCLSSPHGKRQHLAVSHEKGKVTILQLSALLKQADAAKRKLTLTQLSSAPVPCTVLSLTANPANEDCLAVCGLKECHILTFTNTGATNVHIVLTPQLENGNFIKKALWLPGSQTLLALVTADYVKIYELAEDAYSPKYYFLVAVGKIRDCTFVYQNGVYYMMLIASSGYIYYQKLDDQSLAKHGDFYVTNTLDLNHQHIKDVNGQVGGGGVSIYYSHTLQLLFFSYSVGRNFMAPLVDINKGVKCITHLQTMPAVKNSSKGPPQPLCQWTEIPGHPGLICAMMQTSNNPVIFMLHPDRIVMQEIKAQSSKSRVMDMVPIRHTVGGIEKTTLILLCEDGSLRIFNAHPENTSFWLSPQVQPFGNQLYSNSLLAKTVCSSKKNKRKLQTQQKSNASGSATNFPIDFFEHCNLMTDVDFGGNDLLQIYNKQKLKTRLFSAGMFVASTRPNGFTLEVYNSDVNTVMVGIRLLLGTQDPLRAPTTVNILGRSIPTVVQRARWFDIPLTRDEIMQSDKCLKVSFGKSQDPENVCMVDSIEVYGKSKDLLGWSDDSDENTTGTAVNGSMVCASNGAAAGNAAIMNNGNNTPATLVNFGEGFNCITSLDRLVTNLLEVLDYTLNLLGSANVAPAMKQKATKMATTLLLLPTPNPVQVHARYVLATLFGNRIGYHAYKDNEVLHYVNNELEAMKPKLSSTETMLEIDPEAFYRLVLLVRSIANSRPSSLTKICLENNFEIVQTMMLFVCELHKITPRTDEPVSIVRRGLCHTETIVQALVEIWHAFVFAETEQLPKMIGLLIQLLKHDSSIISHSAKEACILLLSPHTKRKKVAILTPPTCLTPTPSNVAAPSSSAVAAAGVAANEVLEAAAAAVNNQAVARSNSVEFGDVNALEVIAANPADHQMLNLDAFMGGNFPQLLNLQQDADDETIMDIAIALSLQQHDGAEAVAGAAAAGINNLQQDLAHLQSLRNAAANNAASVSAGGSDDEGSNVATDGSTLRTSPAEPAEGAGSGGSESGGSCIESIGGISGRSSTYGDQANASPPRSANTHSEKSNITTAMSVDMPTTSARAVLLANAMSSENDENEADDDLHMKLHDLRLSILENIIEFIPSTFYNCNGVQAIPLIQVILVLTTDLNGNNERDQKALQNLLLTLVDFVEMNSTANVMKMKERNAKHEVSLALLCLFGVLMGKTKSKQAGTTSPPHQFKDNASFVASTTAAVLTNSGSFKFCLLVLESMLSHWKTVAQDINLTSASTTNTIAAAGAQVGTPNAASSSSGAAATAAAGASSSTNSAQNILKPMRYGPKPDVSTLIPHNYLKNYPDVFESYDSLLTEITVRLPYQILRLSPQLTSADWYVGYSESLCFILCEYMMLNLNALLRRQVRKLLMYLCGNKEKFRMYRDGHSLNVHFDIVKRICNLHNTKHVVLSNQSVPLLNYDSLVELTEHLRTCQEVSQVRTGNWQKFCLTHEDVLPALMEIACYQLDDGVSPIILQLLQAALCSGTPTVVVVKQQQAQIAQVQTQVTTTTASAQQTQQQQQQPQATTSAKARNERDKSEETDNLESKFDAAHCPTFVNTLFRYVSDALLNKFVRIFLLETNVTSLRWQAHSLIFAIYEHASERQKEKLIEILWNMWPLMPAFGRRTAQFVDILGYLTLSTKSIEAKLPFYTEKAVEVLRQQNEQLAQHPNTPIYSTLEQVLQVNGYYLESEPCLVCNNPEVPLTNIKLPSIKSDSKFTTTTMIVKLVQSHTISKLIVRIADLKRTKMVRTINIHYNNRTVQAVVELKNRPALWHKARSVTLQSGQTEVKIDFPLPITACNLMIEYADFYETVTGSSENLQCPRCSAAVPAYPGVCANCGENVFQCHKCRAINYDEKDPFLCHSCGFCKYAKFDFSIYGRVCCAVDPIESAEDRAKTVQIIHSSLERADRIYRQLQALRTMMEVLVQKVAEQHYSDRLVDDNMATVHTTSQVSKLIQLLAQKYCVESRASFEELSKIVQKVKACRSELVAYDRSQENPSKSHVPDTRENCGINRCYGCALASTEQCLTLLRAIASNYGCRMNLYAQGLVEELAQNNLRSGTPQIQEEVRHLLVLLTKGNREACMQLLELISERIKGALMGTVPIINLDAVVHHEMILLEVLITQDDFCWEQKLKVVFELFVLSSRNPRGGIIAVVQPCLRIIQMLIYTNSTTLSNKTYRDVPPALSSIDTIEGLTVQFNKWLQGYPDHSYEAWRARMPTNNTITASAAQCAANFSSLDEARTTAVLQTLRQPPSVETTDKNMREADVINEKRQQVRETYLTEKYAIRWRLNVLNKKNLNAPLELNAAWLQPLLFNPNSRAERSSVCSLLSALSRTFERRVEILNLLTGFLKYVGEVGECSTEFLALYRTLAVEAPWYHYLTLRGVLLEVSDLMTTEIYKIHHLEETTLSSDLSQGFALRQLVELLAMFLSKPKIRQVYKTRLLGPVLEGYLSLRKLVVQRTRLIDDAQEKLLEMLEEMTTGTEEETRAFMEILIDTVEKTNMQDIKTPVFIFERLYSIIHPEENDESEFFMTLEKDPQQEDFLQGRMLGNPYSSTEAGLGPLMRDVKNKICTDCELIALLEDDNGMELLVNNKIISLDLPVKEVYKKIWLAEGGERDAMRIVYRMRGLLGDATEEFVERLSNKSQEEVDTEQLYRMANVLADCNGLKVMLDRIGSLQNITRTRELIQVLLKLFLISVKVRRCQEVLCQPELGAINTLLKVLQMCLQSEPDSIQSAVTEQLLDIMETILSKAASESLDLFLQFSLTFGGPEYVTALISCTNCANVRNNPSVLRHLIRVLAALVYGNEMKMALLCEHFKDILNFNRFDAERSPEEEFKLELFCVLTNQIEHNCIGGTLKDYIVSMGIVEHAIDYITKHAPCVKPTLLRTDSDELKEFISRPSLKYILRFLTGLANKHEATQLAISKDIIPIIHRLEQVSSDEHVGSLAENLLEALCTDETTAGRVQEVRDFTRTEKKRLAMATREKQLDALGMRTNEKGQVTAKGSILQKIEKLRDETGLTCFICREGYSCQPAKVLGIYTFTKRCGVEAFEPKPRKTIGYTTVTHFNVVHVDCHTSAIRLARGRDEWERASLQNANTRCNGLLPLWGPDVSEAAFSACMTRHSGYMQESTQRVDITFPSSIHDLKLLLMRFAWERSFHDDAGGGGPQSNMHFVPYLLFYSVYLLLSSRSAARDSKNLMSYLTAAPSEKWLESGYDVEGPLYMVTISLALHSTEIWNKHKLAHLQRLIAIAQARHVSPSVQCKALLSASDRETKEYSVYRPFLLMWALVNLIYNTLFNTVSTPKEEDWSISLFDYIRKNDEAMLKATDAILQTFTDEFLPCASFGEFCDVAGLFHLIENPDTFIADVLATLPTTASTSTTS